MSKHTSTGSGHSLGNLGNMPVDLGSPIDPGLGRRARTCGGIAPPVVRVEAGTAVPPWIRDPLGNDGPRRAEMLRICLARAVTVDDLAAIRG